jgi:aminoglycoside/choline kinase family phosphotransferase
MALVSFRPAHITLSASILRELNEIPALADGVPIAPNPDVPPPQGTWTLVAAEYSRSFMSISPDLIKAWAADKEMRRKVDQALHKFGEFEEKTKKLIRDVLDSEEVHNL